MTREWYKVLVVALLMVTRVTLEVVEERWPQADDQTAEGDNLRAVGGDREDQAVDYSDEHMMDSESRKDLVSNEELDKNISDGEIVGEMKEESNDDDEVEDLAYDSDIEKIYSKTNLEDVDTGEQSRHDKVMFEPHGRRSQFRSSQHWNDKPECVIIRRGREKLTQKELNRDTRELVTREPTVYYDMKRAKRRMLAFPRRGSDHRESLSHTKEELRVTSTSEKPSPKTTRTTNPTQEKQTSPNNDINLVVANSTETHYKDASDLHHKREKSYNTWSRFRDNSDDSSEEQEGRMDVMPYSDETRKKKKPQRGRGKSSSSSSSESEEKPVYVPQHVIKNKTAKGKLVRTTTTATLHRTKVHTTEADSADSSSDDSDETTPSAEALDISIDQKSAEKTTKRVKNFYPIKYNSRKFGSEYKSIKHEGKSPEEFDDFPSTTSSSTPLPSTSVVYRSKEKSSEILQESSQEFSSEESKNVAKESDEGSSEEIEIDFNHIGHKSNEETTHISEKKLSPQRSTTISLEVIEEPHHHHHINHEVHHSSTHQTHLVLNTSHEAEHIPGRRDFEEFYPGVGKVPLKVTPEQGIMSEPEFPAPVPVAGMEELFILPEASHTMRRHWESFYKSVSGTTRPMVSSHVAAVLLLQFLFVI